MLSNNEEIISVLKQETNDLKSIIYRKMKVKKYDINIIFNEPLISSDKVSDFIIRSLSRIKINKDIFYSIENNISNFKYVYFYSYEKLCFYLHKGFTIILVDGINKGLALETKAQINRSIAPADVEHTIRGSKDSFVEEYQINIGLIKKRLKTNKLWIDEYNVGTYTNTQIGILYLKDKVNNKLLKKIKKKIENINDEGILNISFIKKYLEKNGPFPTTITTQRPEVVASALINGKIVITCDNSPFMLIIPTLFVDFFKTTDDYYNRKTNTNTIRVLKYFAFFLSILLPSIYISLVTVNHEIIPSELLINFAIQRDGVPFPAFIEALIMIISFEILKECDLRVPSFSGSALSIVGALILGEAAVNAGIVSPIMIIVIATTAITSLPFNEVDFASSIRVHRILCMFSCCLLGIIGIVIFLLAFMIRCTSEKSGGYNYLYPISPFSKKGFFKQIIKRKETN